MHTWFNVDKRALVSTVTHNGPQALAAGEHEQAVDKAIDSSSSERPCVVVRLTACTSPRRPARSRSRCVQQQDVAAVGAAHSTAADCQQQEHEPNLPGQERAQRTDDARQRKCAWDNSVKVGNKAAPPPRGANCSVAAHCSRHLSAFSNAVHGSVPNTQFSDKQIETGTSQRRVQAVSRNSQARPPEAADANMLTTQAVPSSDTAAHIHTALSSVPKAKQIQQADVSPDAQTHIWRTRSNPLWEDTPPVHKAASAKDIFNMRQQPGYASKPSTVPQANMAGAGAAEANAAQAAGAGDQSGVSALGGRAAEPALQSIRQAAARMRKHLLTAQSALAELPAVARTANKAGSHTEEPDSAATASVTIPADWQNSKYCQHSGFQPPAEAPLRFKTGTAQPAVELAPWQEHAARAWLSQLRLELTEDEEHAPPLRNPLYNGALLRDLALTLHVRRQHDMHIAPVHAALAAKSPHPRSLAQARGLVTLALIALGVVKEQSMAQEHGKSGQPCHSSAHCHVDPVSKHDPAAGGTKESAKCSEDRTAKLVERFLSGSRREVWGLLFHIRTLDHIGCVEDREKGVTADSHSLLHRCLCCTHLTARFAPRCSRNVPGVCQCHNAAKLQGDLLMVLYASTRGDRCACTAAHQLQRAWKFHCPTGSHLVACNRRRWACAACTISLSPIFCLLFSRARSWLRWCSLLLA